jgi:futalosine hydrolase
VRILVVAATVAEIDPFVAGLHRVAERGFQTTRYAGSGHDVDVLISGVGMVAAAARTAQSLVRERYDLALNLGVCGAFDRDLELGTVVHVVSDRMPELGAEDGDAFLTIQQLELLDDDAPPFRHGRLENRSPPSNSVLQGLRRVDGITVNTVHGDERSIECVTQRVAPHVESMEGAGFMYACLIGEVSFAQVRAVSNLVERRNRPAWKLGEAISNLCTTARRILES